MYLLTDNTENSIKDFEKCVSLDPNFAIAVMQGHYAHYRQAVSQNSMSGINRVIEKFKRDLRKFPKCTEAYILLAQILMDQQQFDDADKYFQSAIDIDPANATLRVHRAEQCARAIALILNGLTVCEVANVTKYGRSTINRAVIRLRLRGSYERRPGSGRNRTTAAWDDRSL
ncbi:Mitochondrial import receptor subunit TOM70 [Homalodisca vitripennis]|nr:Mitochondrial import receptor subunit TOM70 [Homalodisca vitripennis]